MEAARLGTRQALNGKPPPHATRKRKLRRSWIAVLDPSRGGLILRRRFDCLISPPKGVLGVPMRKFSKKKPGPRLGSW